MKKSVCLDLDDESRTLVLDMAIDGPSPFTDFCMLISLDSWARDTSRLVEDWLHGDWSNVDEGLFGDEVMDSMRSIERELDRLRNAIWADSLTRFADGRIYQWSEDDDGQDLR